ncbi:MAG: NRDE family protein, partial [Acidimicrobiales bacterium]
VLAHGTLPDDLSDYDRFHLLRADLDRVELWTWDAEHLTHVDLEPGAHIVVNLGLDTTDDPLVPHFAPLLADLPEPAADLADAWADWVTLLEGDHLDPGDERALLVRREIEGRSYGSTSASLVALGPDRIRYAFSPTPHQPGSWYDVLPAPVEVT